MTIDARVAAPSGPGFRQLLTIAALSVVCALFWTAPGWAQVPDNRGVKLDPEDPVSPAYRDTLDERDTQRLRDAREQGDSFMPMFHGVGRASGETAGDAPVAAGARNDNWPGRSVSAREPGRPAERPRPVYEHVDRLDVDGADGTGGLAALVDVLLEGWTRPPEIARLRYGRAEARVADGAADTGRTAPPSATGGGHAARLSQIRAGDGFYARTVYAVDSDYPGPVVLELLQPPLTGAVATGGFERAGQRLVLRLTSLTWGDRTLPIDAWAVDLDCACYGIEGEVDRHFLSRVVLPAAARFAEGFLSAAAMPARTLTLHDGTVLDERESDRERELYAGLGAATRSLGDILMADAPRETTVRIPRDTPLVAMFAAPPGGRERTDGRN